MCEPPPMGAALDEQVAPEIVPAPRRNEATLAIE